VGLDGPTCRPLPKGSPLLHHGTRYNTSLRRILTIVSRPNCYLETSLSWGHRTLRCIPSDASGVYNCAFWTKQCELAIKLSLDVGQRLVYTHRTCPMTVFPVWLLTGPQRMRLSRVSDESPDAQHPMPLSHHRFQCCTSGTSDASCLLIRTKQHYTGHWHSIRCFCLQRLMHLFLLHSLPIQWLWLPNSFRQSL
jgi:hypothetical protein